MGRGGMRGMMMLAAMAVMAPSAQAQERLREPVGYVGINFVGADPVSPLDTYIDNGFGAQIYGTLPMEASRHLRLRADFGFLIYGNEHQRVCFGGGVGCRVELDMNTTNSILYGGIGPELVLATGAIEPYVNASFGFSWFGTTTSLDGSWDNQDFANTTNYSDGMFAWRGGGGVRLRVSSGRVPVAIDLGVERHQNGVARFLTKGDIVDNPDGSITVYPNQSEANMVTMRMGVTIGIPHKDHDRKERKGRW